VSNNASSRRKRLCPQMFFHSASPARKLVEFQTKATIFAQGDAARSVIYIQEGRIKLSVFSATGGEAVVAILGPDDFLGEGCLTDQPVRIGTATAIAPSTLLVIERDEMIRALHQEHEFFRRFVLYIVSRNIRVEEDLVDQLLNSAEKRLARTLLLLARPRKDDQREEIVPQVTQETLAEMVGTTRTRVNVFMNRFKKRGFISYSNGLHINRSLLSAVTS